MESELCPIRDIGPYEIQQYQQNRYPCFFVDCITEAVPGKSAKGFKNFSYNEWFFPAHFADEPNVPGFIQIETLTQVFLMTFLTMPENKGKKTGFIAVKDARFRQKIVPGDRLDIEAELRFFRRGLAKGVSKGYVNGNLCCSLELEVAIPEILTKFRPVPRGGVIYSLLYVDLSFMRCMLVSVFFRHRKDDVGRRTH